MSEKPILFISDLHLEAERPDITQAFFSFLEEHASKAQALYILGDFFNVWLGDDYVTELNTQVAEALQTLTKAGLKIKLMHGNRDFLMGKDFAKRCGAELIEEPYLLAAYEQEILLMHGDILCTRDLDYMAFRSMVRDPEWQESFLARPIAERIAYAEQAREQSKAMSSNKAEDIMDVTPEAVTALMQKYKIDTLIHGHTHRPYIHNLNSGSETSSAKRLVLGDWEQDGWYISWTKKQLTLCPFHPTDKTIK